MSGYCTLWSVTKAYVLSLWGGPQVLFSSPVFQDLISEPELLSVPGVGGSRPQSQEQTCHEQTLVNTVRYTGQ